MFLINVILLGKGIVMRIQQKYYLNFQANNINKIYKFAEKDRTVITEKMSLKKQEIAQRNNKILDLLEEGMTLPEIAKKLNVSEGTIRVFTRKNNILKKMTENLKKIILEKLLAGESKEEIMKSLNVKKFFIDKLAEENKVCKTLREKRDKKIVKLIKDGMFISDVAKQFNLSNSQVRKILNDYSEKANTKVKLNNYFKVRATEIHKLLMKGLGIKEIAEKYGISTYRVSDIAKENDTLKKIKAKRNKKIYNLAKKGLTYTKIAKRLNVSKTTVMRALKKERCKNN